jgi:23S rRNA (uracil1939-C5)-methyltransferase
MSNIKEFKGLRAKIRSLDSEAQGVLDWDYLDKIHKVKLPFTLPNEEVELDIVKRRRRKPLGTLTNIFEESPHRTKAKCPHYTICGGCRLQHLEYPEQLAFKEKKIAELFQPLLKFNDVEVRPIIACENPWAYRNKMSFSFGQDKHRERYLGLNQRGKRRVINISDCALCPEWMSKILPKLHQWWEDTALEAYDYRQNTGTLRELTLKKGMRTEDRFVMLSISSNPDFAPSKKQLDDFCAIVKEACSDMPDDSKLSIFLCLHQVMKGQETQIYELLLSGPTTIKERLFLDDSKEQYLDFVLSPQAFFQPNTVQAERIYREAFDLLPSKELGVVYDLYCGNGALGAIAAKRGAKRVYSVELKNESIMDGENNATVNEIKNQEFIWGDVQKVLSKGLSKGKQMERPDVVIVDPPRAGLGQKAIDNIITSNPKYLVYISCNPKTQALDLKELVEVFTLNTLQPVDQFPQTLHVENIAILTRKDLN